MSRTTRPLGLEIEQVLELKGTGQGHTRAYSNWARYHIISAKTIPSHPKLHKLVSCLSLEQSNSYSLLLEWWNGKSQDPVLSEAARFAIETEAGLGNLEKDDIEGLPKWEDNNNRAITGITLLDPLLGESIYHRELFKLYLAEFYYYEHINNDISFLSSLQHQRQRCAVLAASQRISYSCLKTILKPISPVGATGTAISKDLAAIDQAMPFSTSANWFIGGTISPCSWLGLKQTAWRDQNESNSSPYFLWDRTARRTVEVSSLQGRPEYVAISHTWGRWRQNSLCSIPGVPWQIPQNSRFDVMALPDMLLDTKFKAPYVWIDLFCIPQSGTESQLVKIASREIASQAAIFHEASAGAIWLNEISGWNSLQSTIEWMALKFAIGSMPSQHELSNYLDVAFGEADAPTGLYSDYEPGGDPSTEGAEPSGWFSSLWTLQEAFLRPDMWLFDRNWEALGVGDGTPVPLDALIAMVHEHTEIELTSVSNPRDHTDRSALEQQLGDLDFPAGYIELSGLLWSTGMDQLLDASPLTPIILGNQRYCKSRRAYALMSVIGVSEWFDPENDKADQFDDTPETGLILSRYPLNFLNEVKRKLGAIFFASTSITLDDVDKVYPEALLSTDGIGSMLPFGSDIENIKFHSKWGRFDVQDHPSVASWVIKQDGSVMLTQVGMNTSEDSLHDSKVLSIRILAPSSHSTMRGVTWHETKDLNSWMEAYCPSRLMATICLFCGPNTNEGVLLKRTSSGSQTFVKWGNYYISGTNMVIPPSSEVDWRVL